MRGNLLRFSTSAVVIAVLLCFSPCAHAKMELDIVQNVQLEDTPVDMIISRDGAGDGMILHSQKMVEIKPE